MKVLVISVFPPDPAPEANHALHICEHLADSGLAVHVLCKKGSIPATRPGIIIHPVIDDWKWPELPRVARCLRECRPDVVLLLYIGWVFNHEPMITFLPTLSRKILPLAPCVVQFENIDAGPRKPFLTRLLRRMMRLWAGGRHVHPVYGTLLRDSSVVIALSSPHKARLLKQWPAVEEKAVILPPPPLIRFCPDPPALARKQARHALGAADTDFVLIYWGYIYPGKGIETLLRAFRIATRHNKDMRLVLVGGSLDFPTSPISCSDYFQMVRKLPETLGISEKVTWTGHFDWNSDIGSRCLYAGDACVLPFDYGITLNNSSLAAAVTHGLPVIATELPEGRDDALEHGRNVYLCRPRDPEMLAQAIQLISKGGDFAERLRKGAKALAQHWHRWDIMTKRLIGILETAVSSAGSDHSHRRALCQLPEAGFARVSPSAGNKLIPENQEDSYHTAMSPRPGEEILAEADAPLVSVVVAVYNVGKYLSQCLDSLVHQTLKGVEIIVVNDASTDESAAIIDEYRSIYSNIRVIECEHNRGLASVRNIGMRAAIGRYIAFTDGDDWVDIRMCESMYRRASEDDSDVLIANANVFYESSKAFGKFFDREVRRTLDPELRTMPFELKTEPRVLLLEPVAWTKLYRRSFLQEHALEFEDGMNSYEDVCFHFSVLMKAARISLTDEALSFYRQNRPGQISGRTNRKIFEVFAVFQKIYENLSAWNASPDIWAMLTKVQLRQFDWMIKDRVGRHDRREFLSLVAKQFQVIPESGFQKCLRQTSSGELTRLLCMRRRLFWLYSKAGRLSWLFRWTVYAIFHIRRPGVLKRGCRSGLVMLRRRVIDLCRSFASKSLKLSGFEKKIRSVYDGMDRLKTVALRGEGPLVEVCRAGDQTLFLSYPASEPDLKEDVRRIESDYYLLQTAVFRTGDNVLDIGAHVGAVSIYLAKKFPFINVYALEPDPLNYACLKRNIELNGLSNVTAIKKAVSGDGQRRILYASAEEGGWATIDSRMASTRHVLRTVQVETVTLEQLFEEYGIRRCRLLKINAPGAVRESLNWFTRKGCVDLLCGEADLEDCSRVELEAASWRIARQYFWRTIARKAGRNVHSWIQQSPTGCGLAEGPALPISKDDGQQELKAATVKKSLAPAN